MRLIVIVVTAFILVSVAYGEDNFTLSGDVNFKYNGDIYICLFNLEKYAEFQKPGYNLSQPECQHTKMSAELKKAEKVSFRFESIPKGTYCIVSYQDENMNGKVDFENYIINEPWGTYREGDPIMSSTWDLIKFELVENVSGIKIQM